MGSRYREVAAILPTLPAALLRARRSRGLNMVQAARQIGISETTVARIESGNGCHTGTLWLVLRWLDRIANNDPTTVVRTEPLQRQKRAAERSVRTRQLRASGLSLRQIGRELGITNPTVLADLRTGGNA